MRKKYNVSPSTVKRLMMLFDDNSCILVIKGRKSNALLNHRGLLQGSTLSPILFNFFIDPLLWRLKIDGQPIDLLRVSINSLAYADDIVIFAEHRETLQNLLDMCTEWSLNNEMEFAASKCVHLGQTDAELSGFFIGNAEIPSCISAKYLGIPFTRRGADLEANVENRTRHTAALIRTLAIVGMRRNGFSTDASVRLYKAFIRPTLEYGLQLKIISEEGINRLERAQCVGLRTILSVPLNTSINAMHRIACLESMSLRNQTLNYTFFSKLTINTLSSSPAQDIWRAAVDNMPDLAENSVVRYFATKQRFLSP